MSYHLFRQFWTSAVLIATATFSQAQSHPLQRSVLFRENKGQVMDQHGYPRPDIVVSGHANGLTFHLDRWGMHYQLVKSHDQHNRTSADYPEGFNELPAKTEIYRVDVQWAGANPHPVIEYLDPVPGVEHFYNVPKGMKPALHVKSYREVRYKNVYPGIDVRFYEKDGNLEYDFEVAPHAHPDNIRMAISGAVVTVNDKNELCMKTPFGEIREGGLEVWQGSQRINASWKVKAEAVGFSLGDYDPSKPLRIDPPVRVWGTYYGGTGNDYGYGIVTDSDGNVYWTGETSSTTNIATSGAYQTSFNGVIGGDAYVAKFNSNGQIVWGTYFGAASDDEGRAIALDLNGRIFVGGVTASDFGFATAGAHQTTYGGGGLDGFLACFTADGFPIWVTYYGGPGGFDEVSGVATDANGNIFIGGFTSSPSGIATAGTHQTTQLGDYDCFVAKFNPTGQRLWGTYLGNSGRELGRRIAVDAAGAVYLAGSSNSSTGIASAGAYQTTYGGSNDAILAKFTPNGALAFCTYYGGNSQDWGNAVHVASNGDIFLAGSTKSGSGIATAGTHQTTHAATFYYDAFLVKFNAAGQRQWATYCGGTFDDDGFGVGQDNAGNVYLAGTSISTNGIATTDGYQNALAQSGTTDLFVVKFNNTGQRQWGTYYGGGYEEIFGQFICTPAGELLLTGRTRSSNNIASAGAHQSTYAGTFPNYDAFLVKFAGDLLPVKLLSFEVKELPAAVRLQWATASEINTSHFEIQRLGANQTGWSAIGRQHASGNSSTRTSYQYLDTDSKPAGHYQYRLKMVDKDGSYSYSPVRVVRIGGPSNWQVYPTVVQQKRAHVQLSEPCRLTLLDMQGRVLQTYQLPAGNHRLHLPFASGQYRLVNLSVGESQSIIIQ